jgi:hypothetical protein
VRFSRMSRASGSDPCQTLELRDDERVCAATHGEHLAQSRTVAICRSGRDRRRCVRR